MLTRRFPATFFLLPWWFLSAFNKLIFLDLGDKGDVIEEDDVMDEVDVFAVRVGEGSFRSTSLILSQGGSASMSKRLERVTLFIMSNLGLLEGRMGKDWLLAASAFLAGLAGAEDDFLGDEVDDDKVGDFGPE